MKTIATAAIKGGVGKSTITANLGLALKEMGYKVGFLDIDITGSTLSRALGVEPPKWELDTGKERVVVPKVNGYWLLAIASHVGEDYAVLWGGSQHSELAEARERIDKLIKDRGTTDLRDAMSKIEQVRRIIDDVLAASKWRFVSELLSDEVVTWPEPLDYLLCDLPPSTSEEMFSFLALVKSLFGVIIVSQPSLMSTIGLQRTIDLLRVRRIPIIGLVVNQDGFLNCHGEIEYQFLSPRVDLEKVAQKSDVPFLMSIPQTGDAKRLERPFAELARKVINAKPVTLKEVDFTRRLKRKVVKGLARLYD